jgi:hypothetical protein
MDPDVQASRRRCSASVSDDKAISRKREFAMRTATEALRDVGGNGTGCCAELIPKSPFLGERLGGRNCHASLREFLCQLITHEFLNRPGAHALDSGKYRATTFWSHPSHLSHLP